MAIRIVAHARGTEDEFGLRQLLKVILFHFGGVLPDGVSVPAHPQMRELGRHQLVYSRAVLPTAVVDDEEFFFCGLGVLLHGGVDAGRVVLHAEREREHFRVHRRKGLVLVCDPEVDSRVVHKVVEVSGRLAAAPELSCEGAPRHTPVRHMLGEHAPVFVPAPDEDDAPGPEVGLPKALPGPHKVADRTPAHRRDHGPSPARGLQLSQGAPRPLLPPTPPAKVLVGQVHVRLRRPRPVLEIAPRALGAEIPGWVICDVVHSDRSQDSLQKHGRVRRVAAAH
mmetsp:Transcript_45973/g.103848  ORF Transcript_45973/g.103848 Transcript_45973/m.103848 type:complete len:281 (-) Transcript_45973:111-953(-)